MGFNFRKSKKIGKNGRITFSKSGTSVSHGNKWMRTTYNSKGQKTTTYKIPGTGISYSTKRKNMAIDILFILLILAGFVGLSDKENWYLGLAMIIIFGYLLVKRNKK